jgi:hypothetical protein
MLASDIEAVRAMGREELESRLVALWGEIRHHTYTSDLRSHLPAAVVPPWSDLRLDDEDDD